MKKTTLNINNISVNIKLSGDESDYISLTDIAKHKDEESTGIIIANWLTTKYTIDFIGNWEILNNPNFNVMEFHNIRQEAGSGGFILSSSKWIKLTNAIGITSSTGRYSGGTFAHKDIAFEFATWISPLFKLYLIKEFQRLKKQENEHSLIGWDAKRQLTKINYRLHTDSIKENIVIPQKLTQKDAQIVYANEADVLNKALFGITAEEWKKQNKNVVGNMRDYADVYQLICLANLETLNAEFIKMKLTQQDRLLRLNEIAISQLKSLQNNNAVKKLLKYYYANILYKHQRN